jgi:hypothetical protein
MTLPRKIPKSPKRSSRWRSIAHCNFVRSHGCCSPGCGLGPIEAAHVRVGSGAGTGQRPDDWNTISLCTACHREQHRVGERTFEKVRGIDLSALADEFAKASPKRAEIERIKRERQS